MRGGKREGAGRPPVDYEKAQVTFYFRLETAKLLRDLFPAFERSAFVDGLVYKALKEIENNKS